MFGGVTVLNEDLNLNIKKEIITLLMGPLTQVMFLLLVYVLFKNGLVTNTVFIILRKVNIFLLTFNLLPILPLDGGKLLNNILDLILPFDASHKITLVVSFIFLPCIFLFMNKLFSIFIFVFLLVKLIEEVKVHKYRLRKLLFEYKYKNYKFKKRILINKINEVKRNVGFYIYKDNIKLTERDI